MLSHEEMVGLQAEKHYLIDADNFGSREQYVLHLIHSFAYAQVSTFAAGKTILDFGCNTGYGSRILADKAAMVVGVDVSSEAIAMAKSRPRDNLEFQQTDGRSLPFDDQAFEIIVSCQVIEHIVDYAVYLGELKRVLAPQGLIVFTTPNSRLRLDPGMKPWNEFHVREFDHAELQELLSEHFPAVRILGLSGKEELARIERARLDRALRGARNRQSRSLANRFRSLATRVLPTGLRNGIRSALAEDSQKASGLDQAFIDDHGWIDFHHREDDLADALDLMAICSRDQDALHAALGKMRTS